MITATALTKTYKKYNSDEGIAGLARNFVLRRHENVVAVDAATFSVEAGTCVGLLGANGAGKTTLVKMLTGLLVPTGGDASVLGFRPWERRNEYLRQIGVVMGQRQQLWIDVSARENLRLNQVVYGIPEGEFRTRLESLSRMLGVEKLLSTQIRKLSLGEKMKMELLAAFMHKPRVLFLDEPTIGLDVVAQARIREFIRRKVQEDGVTVLLTSHYLRDLEELCPRVLLIRSGKLVHDGSLKELAGKIASHKRVTWTTKEGSQHREVPASEVAATVRQILDAGGVEDLAVAAPPLEDTIAEVMEHGQHGQR